MSEAERNELLAALLAELDVRWAKALRAYEWGRDRYDLGVLETTAGLREWLKIRA